IFGMFAWLMMMVTFTPLAGAGFFGAKLGIAALIGLLILHLIYGFVLGATYSFLGVVAPIKVPVISPGERPPRPTLLCCRSERPTTAPMTIFRQAAHRARQCLLYSGAL